MAKSFYEYVENKVVESFDFETFAKVVNEHVAEKGSISPEELHEIFDRLRGAIGGAARVASGLGHVAAGIGKRGLQSAGDLVKGTGGAIGSGLKSAGQAIGGAVKSAAGKVAQAGKDFGGRVAADYQSGIDAQSRAQINAHLAQVKNQPWFKAMPPTQQTNILRAYSQTA